MNDTRRHRHKGRKFANRNNLQVPVRQTNYHQLHNPFTPHPVFTDDRIEAIHNTALKVLEELGVKVLLPEAREIFRAGSATVDEHHMVRIGREIIAHALDSAPKSVPLVAGARKRDLLLEPGTLAFQPASGAPNCTDLARGRRPGSLRDFDELIKLAQSFEVLHLLGPMVEPQDVPIEFRHLEMTRSQLINSDKVPFVYARGTEQAHDAFAMLQIARDIDDDQFLETAACFTIINTNSPRQLDIPMSQGIIDFARAGQLSVITPFCLAGAMAPITVAGALTLQHAEALAGIALSQLTRPGAPVLYGNFCSNVDMRSGSPAFGTPEHVKATLGSGQLARLIGLPWRSGGGSASNACDAQGANEAQMGIWGAVMAGATTLVHAAGWLEGGLCTSYEQLITDTETLQTIAELFRLEAADDDTIGFDALAQVDPGGHFFAADHTMERYRTAFYEPINADLSNFGTWEAAGALTAEKRATGKWQQLLSEFSPPLLPNGVADALDAFIARRRQEGGAPAVS